MTPATVPVPVDDAAVDRLAARLRLVAEARRATGIGALLARGPGASLEFHDHRDYQPGDDPRHLDMAAWARTGRPVVGVAAWRRVVAVASGPVVELIDAHNGFEVVTKEQKSKLATGALDYQSKLKKSPEGLYVGNDQVKLASLVLADSTQDKAVDIRFGLSQASGDTAIESGLMRGVVKGQVDDVQVNQQKVGTLTLDAGLERLDAGAMKVFNEAFGVQAMLQCKGSNPAQQMKILEAQAEAFLAKDPKYSQKMSLKTGEGESVLAFHLQTKGLTKNDFANPDLLTKKLDAAVSMQVPKSLVERLIKDLSPADAVESTLATFQEGLGMGVQQGFVVSDGKLIKANFTAQQGSITLNGKPFDPMQLMGAH